MKPAETLPLQSTVSVDTHTGDVLAVYLRVRIGKAAETREFADGNAFADYDNAGKLLGVEVLGPCEAKDFDRISRGEPKSVKRFLRGSLPVQMLIAPDAAH